MRAIPTPPGGSADGVAEFAQTWATQVSALAYVPMTWTNMVDFLEQLTLRLVAALRAERFEPTAGYQVGADLVAADFVAPEALARTVTLLHTRLLPAIRLSPEGASARLTHLVEALSVGHSRAFRDFALDEQEAFRITGSTRTYRKHAGGLHYQ